MNEVKNPAALAKGDEGAAVAERLRGQGVDDESTAPPAKAKGRASCGGVAAAKASRPTTTAAASSAVAPPPVRPEYPAGQQR